MFPAFLEKFSQCCHKSVASRTERIQLRLKCIMILVIVTFLSILTVSASETNVSCVYTENCVLPCTFLGGDEVIIKYLYLGKSLCVHFFYDNKDDLKAQDERFRNRTSLFKDQISRGNTSLLLRRVKIEDEGAYECTVSSTTGMKRSIIYLRVYAPVSEVSISQEGNRITCSSEGIYPEPELTWSTSPPSNMELQDRTRVQQTEEQLYSISSSLMVSDRDPDLSYSCTVRTQRNQRNQRRATLNKPTSVEGSKYKTSIPCCSDVPVSSFTWRFNHSQIILTKTEGETSSRVSEEWRKHVEEVSESGSLTLKDLTPQQEGVYTCEARNKEETIKTDIFLRISPGNPGVGIIIGVILALFIVVLVLVLVLCYVKKKNGKIKKHFHHFPVCLFVLMSSKLKLVSVSMKIPEEAESSQNVNL
ncbi:uncharacterized protein LOC108228352 isoform X3 [Kryptolebias marmoratus]|uniref:uncharacterized protein LOC108228352 isoform X3 n=1 Tax=Kryptolebias marmoratus TaxID=37003 RepID=UPI0018ACB066|nr:uncharacterized protein LOC108228352 isoform X3 [Kryptolebias marmoratus]